MSQEIYEPLGAPKGVVPPQLYPNDAHYPSPYPPITPGAQPSGLQHPAPKKWQAAMEANRIAGLQTPQPRESWHQPQTNVHPSAPQLPLLSAAGNIGATTASNPYGPQYHRTVAGLLGVPQAMQPRSSSPAPSNWGCVSGSGYQHLTATPLQDPQTGDYFYHTLPSDQSFVRNSILPPPHAAPFLSTHTDFSAQLMLPFSAEERSQQTQFQEMAAGGSGVQSIRGNPYSRSTYIRQFHRELPSQPPNGTVPSHQPILPSQPARPQKNQNTEPAPSHQLSLPPQTGLPSTTQTPGAVPSSQKRLMAHAQASDKVCLGLGRAVSGVR